MNINEECLAKAMVAASEGYSHSKYELDAVCVESDVGPFEYAASSEMVLFAP